MAPGVAGLILAGGRGERFGGPKAAARVPDGRTFLAACRDALAAGGAAPIVATLPPGWDAAHCPAGLLACVLPADGLAMFDSLGLGLAALGPYPWRAVVVLPVDHPLVAASTVAALAAADARTAAGVAAAVATYRGKHGHPVVIARSVADEIAAGRAAGPTLREVLRAAGRVDVDVDDPGVVANCNTPERLREAMGLGDIS